jgi:DNA polymerase-3 subunit beta
MVWESSARHSPGFSFTQPSRPAVLSGQREATGEADTSYRYVLMPVRFAS